MCSVTAINSLFDHTVSTSHASVFPLRAVWRENQQRQVGCPQFLISIPKKKLHHAVDRVKMRRRVRETYRLHHQEHLSEEKKVDIIFIYLPAKLMPYNAVEEAMIKLLTKINASLEKGES